MKQLLTLLFSVIFSVAVFAQDKASFSCPMHPEIVAEAPGKCPKCGMNLVSGKSHNHHKSDDAKANDEKVSFGGKKVRYDLYARDTIVNFTGKKRRAIAVNGKLAAPTLHFTEGDTAEIYLHNQLKESASFHWHGVILPNPQDGVPFLTTKLIKPGDSHLYTFKVSQNGTYWYHSHSRLQEQIGMNGVLVFHKRNDPKKNYYKADIPVLLGEWSDEKPEEIMRRLHMNNTEWYAIKKNAVQSYSEAIQKGHFLTKLKNEWLRMEAMDISDVYYEKFLINGKVADEYRNLSAGDKVRLRVVNGGSSSYFWLNFGGGKFKVIANDGNDVEPVEVDRLIVGNSETYDIEIEIPQNKSYEFRATAEDRSGYASLWLGSGEKVEAPTLPRLELFEGMKMMNSMMKMSGDMKPMNMTMSNQTMDMNSVMYPELPKHEREMMMKHMDEMMDMSNVDGHSHHHSSHENYSEHSMHHHSQHSENHEGKSCCSDKNHSHENGHNCEHSEAEKFTCPMHPEIISNEKGKCPKCKMDLVPMKNGGKNQEGKSCCSDKNHSHENGHNCEHSDAEKFTCPMHPEIISNEKGICPKCKMDLVPMKNGGKNHSHENGHGSHSHSANHSEHSNHESSIVTLNYDMLAAPEKNILPTENVRTLKFTLEGNMLHYLWSLDNKTVLESDKILIKKGEVLRIEMYNNSMMRHPMHLHGHDFRLLNAKGDYAPLKNVVDIMPMETNTIEFPANQDGDWFFHCHILYHMMGGMGRVFSYENSAPNPQLPNQKEAWRKFKNDNRMFSTMGMLGVQTNMLHADAMAMLGARYAAFADVHYGYHHKDLEAEVKAGRYLGKFQWAMPYISYRYQNPMSYEMAVEKKTMFGQQKVGKYRNTAAIGLEYVLPFLIMGDASVDMNGKFLLSLSREDIPLSPRFRGNFMVNTDREFSAGISYILSKYISLSAGYDNHSGFGGGIIFNY
ncbi:multicopper oxidase domain-containing protein [Cruoricaptor ignavus]|uniref:multicopper oxidase domain-containing protein n=1 Tax=Cruoricaptor ignavus TaxID=1118202 RepID=UPI00370D3D18